MVICASRPCNPTSNVFADDKVGHLLALAKSNNSYLLLDNAYGVPFPNIIYKEAQPVWDGNVILTYSLSKIGLPIVRTGIVIRMKS